MAVNTSSRNRIKAIIQRFPKKAYPTVSRYSTVLLDTNTYSVPCRYAGKSAMLKVYPNYIEVWIAGALIARHERLFGRRGESLDLQHYLPTLAQKGREIRYAHPVQNTVPGEFLNWLESHNLTAKEMMELLGQCSEFGYAAVMCGRIPNNLTSVVEDPVTVPVVDLGAYDAICGKKGGCFVIGVKGEQIRLLCKQLKLPTFANYMDILRQSQPGADFSDLLLDLLLAETNARQENQNRRRLKAAGFPFQKTLDEFDFSRLNPSVSPVFVQELAS